jgi:hypothetical protein
MRRRGDTAELQREWVGGMLAVRAVFCCAVCRKVVSWSARLTTRVTIRADDDASWGYDRAMLPDASLELAVVPVFNTTSRETIARTSPQAVKAALLYLLTETQTQVGWHDQQGL